MESLRNLTHQETLILQAITLTTPIPLEDVAFIYKVVQSFDKTIAVINESQELGETAIYLIKENAMSIEGAMGISKIINKIEE